MRAEGLALGNAVCCLAGCLALAAACTGHGTDDRAAWWMAQRAGDAATPPAHVTSQAGARAAASEQDAAAGIAAADGGGDAALDAGDTGRSGWLGDAQRSGSAGRGRDLLLNNGTPEAPYLSCGIPDKLWQLGTLGGLADSTKNEPRIADRQQGNAELPYYLSYARVASGVRVITTNCLLCHASKLGGSLVMGLGDPNRDFAQKGSVFGIPIAALQVAGVVLSAAERVELDRFRNRLEAVNAYTTTDTVGMNPADTLFGVLAAHRDPVTLTWHDTADPNATLTPEVRLTSDVPAWWNLHRRDRMFWNGFGRGDHARIMMSAALLCMKDAGEAAAIDAYFPDLRAYVLSLKAPSYEQVAQRAIDYARAKRGKALYRTHCETCHGGRYGSAADPRPFVALGDVGTDPVYATTLAANSSGGGDALVSYFFDFFNDGWYGSYGAAGKLVRVPEPGYSPPPLDGVWATAPYFHNGSVPTLDAVLDAKKRPRIFRRSTDPSQYDFERCGYPSVEVSSKGNDPSVYDATRPRFGNGGHDFASDLDASAQRDLLEFLKTF